MDMLNFYLAALMAPQFAASLRKLFSLCYNCILRLIVFRALVPKNTPSRIFILLLGMISSYNFFNYSRFSIFSILFSDRPSSFSSGRLLKFYITLMEFQPKPRISSFGKLSKFSILDILFFPT